MLMFLNKGGDMPTPVNAVLFSTEGRGPATGLDSNIRPPVKTDVPQNVLEGEGLYNEHVKFKRMTEMTLSQNELKLFGELKRILTMMADNNIPENDDGLRAELRTLKEVDALIKKKMEIPVEILELYRSRRNDIEHNLKAYVKRRFGGYDDQVDLPPNGRPKEGIAYICKKAKLALIFV
jgi:hypothetical protein